MTLAELINALEKEDPNLVVPNGFSSPHSYRGYYEDLAFEPTKNITVGEMLMVAKSMLGKIMEGYKGGEYKVYDFTECWIAEYGTTKNSETIGPRLLQYIISEAKAARE